MNHCFYKLLFIWLGNKICVQCHFIKSIMQLSKDVFFKYLLSN